MSLIEVIVVLGGLVALAVTWFLTRRRYVARLDRLNAELDNIAIHREFSQRVTEGERDDAISRLQRRVNDMFDSLAADDHADDERENLFRDLADGVHEAVLVLRDHVIYANPRAAALRGMRQDDLIGKPMIELFHADDRERAARMLRSSLGGAPPEAPVELRMVNRDGDAIWVEATTRLIDYDDRPALVFAAYDITDRKERLEKLSRERDRASTTLHSIADGVITTDAQGKIDYMNNAAEKLLGEPLGDARGRALVDIVSLVDESDRKPLRDPVEQSLAQKRRVNLGRRAMMLAAGEEYSIELSVSPILDDHEVQGTVIVLHDVTELRGLARQMTYQASHDALTGLINKREFERRLEEALVRTRGDSQQHVLCYMDL
ncbi:MAG: PAS domain S-box protein, partial [Gammaproteobacteria bacterium]|nr:PAS domain S-box protein [Gammaproteobacteria bacterium]